MRSGEQKLTALTGELLWSGSDKEGGNAPFRGMGTRPGRAAKGSRKATEARKAAEARAAARVRRGR
ncbi:hypothetical protein STENM223S_06181 [Streptomyces tendae]